MSEDSIGSLWTLKKSETNKARFLNKKDEAFRFLCLFVSRDLLFHLLGLKTPKEIWDKLETLYGKQDDLRVYQLENELMSLQPSNFETLNDFFHKVQAHCLTVEAMQSGEGG